MEATRRSVLRLLAFGGICSLCGTRIEQSYGQNSELRGCCIPAGELATFTSGRQRTGFAAISNETIDSTGNPTLDKALGKALLRLSSEFSERPGFGFIDDSDGPNAYASPESNVLGTWGTVVFGQTLFRKLLDECQDEGVAVLTVTAHEFGHVAQFRSGLDKRLLTGQSTVRRIELHADFLAGYYLGYRKRAKSSLSVWAAGHTLYSFGDYHFNSPKHHGTPQQRIDSAESGYKLGFDGGSFSIAFQKGAEYVIGLGG
jgi:hypothetical protein